MKREAMNHPKLQLLARDLHLDICCARGVIESLWLVAQTNFPQGDVGRWTDEEIAIAMGWSGDAAQLIGILRRRKLLDPLSDAAGRLYVHDWHEHAEDWVHVRLARAGLTFANGVEPKISKLSRREREHLAKVRTTSAQCAHNERTECPEQRTTAASPSPSPSPSPYESSTQAPKPDVKPGASDIRRSSQNFSPASAAKDAAAAAAPANGVGTHTARAREGEPEPEPEDHGSERKSSSSTFAAARRLAKELAGKHPRRGSLQAAVAAIENEHLNPEGEEQMRQSHERYVAYYARERPEFVPNLARWVEDGDWQRMPPDEMPVKKPPVLSPLMKRLMQDPDANVDLYKRARGMK